MHEIIFHVGQMLEVAKAWERVCHGNSTQNISTLVIGNKIEDGGTIHIIITRLKKH